MKKKSIALLTEEIIDPQRSERSFAYNERQPNNYFCCMLRVCAI